MPRTDHKLAFWGRFGAFAGYCATVPEVTEYQTVQDIYEGMVDEVEHHFGKAAAKAFADGFHDSYVEEGLTWFHP